MNNKRALKASELVVQLQKWIEAVGDLEISVNTHDGDTYSLYGADDVSLVVWNTKDGGKKSTIEIG